MKIGLTIDDFTWPSGPAKLSDTLKAIATADQAGFDSIWVMDHFWQIRMNGPEHHDMLEGYSALSYMAALTSRAKLGTMVTGAVYRYPGILAKTVTTLDVPSGGRAWLGIGAAWNEAESRGLGIPFPPISERSNGSRRRCGSASRCGKASEVASSRSLASTTSRSGYSTRPNPSPARTHLS